MSEPNSAGGWSASLDAALIAAFDDGRSIAQLADALGRPPEDIWRRLDAFGRVTSGDRLTTPIRGLLPRFEYPNDMRP